MSADPLAVKLLAAATRCGSFADAFRSLRERAVDLQRDHSSGVGRVSAVEGIPAFDVDYGFATLRFLFEPLALDGSIQGLGWHLVLLEARFRNHPDVVWREVAKLTLDSDNRVNAPDLPKSNEMIVGDPNSNYFILMRLLLRGLAGAPLE